MYPSCWQLTADLLASSSRASDSNTSWHRLDKATSLKQTCCSLRVSSCVVSVYVKKFFRVSLIKILPEFARVKFTCEFRTYEFPHVKSCDFHMWDDVKVNMFMWVFTCEYILRCWFGTCEFSHVKSWDFCMWNDVKVNMFMWIFKCKIMWIFTREYKFITWLHMRSNDFTFNHTCEFMCNFCKGLQFLCIKNVDIVGQDSVTVHWTITARLTIVPNEKQCPCYIFVLTY